jgi:hypothetical protein
MLRKLHHLAFRDSPDQIQMQPALSLLGLWISRRPGERISDQRECGEGSTANHKQQFPVGEEFFQRSTPYTPEFGNVCERNTGDPPPERIPRQDTSLPYAFYSTECGQGVRSQEAGGCTGLCNTPIPETETSIVSPAVRGPTPAGVPVAITSPGNRVIMRESQRIRNSTG